MDTTQKVGVAGRFIICTYIIVKYYGFFIEYYIGYCSFTFKLVNKIKF